MKLHRISLATLFILLTAGCAASSPRIDSTTSAQNGVTAEATATLVSGAIIVRPPSIFVGPAPGTASANGVSPLPTVLPEGWQTLTSSLLGVALDYPSDWSVANNESETITFTSPQGAEIQMQTFKTNSDNQDAEAEHQQCITLINSYGLSVNSCIDDNTHMYRAKFDLKSKNDLNQQVLLSTMNPEALSVYKHMLNSLRPVQ